MDSLTSKRHTRSGSETRQRSARPAMRCSAAELAQLEASAERAGMTVGAFMRHQCLGTAGPRAARRPPVERAILAQMLGHLGRCGSNVNQIARTVNSGGEAPAWLAETMTELRATAASISRALGRAAC